MSKIFNLFLVMFLILVTIQATSVEAELEGGYKKGSGVYKRHVKVTRYAVKPVTVCWKQVVVWKKISCCCNKSRKGPKRCICFRKFLAWKKVGCCAKGYKKSNRKYGRRNRRNNRRGGRRAYKGKGKY